MIGTGESTVRNIRTPLVRMHRAANATPITAATTNTGIVPLRSFRTIWIATTAASAATKKLWNHLIAVTETRATTRLHEHEHQGRREGQDQREEDDVAGGRSPDDEELRGAAQQVEKRLGDRERRQHPEVEGVAPELALHRLGCARYRTRRPSFSSCVRSTSNRSESRRSHSARL